jgi:hypothetical protein
MFSNSFLHELRSVDLYVLRAPGLLPSVSRLLDPVSNGTPLQRANTYTYRTADYLLATAQRYHAGKLNDQHHVWSATVSNRLSVFTAHPPVPRKGKSPETDASYWVGPGRLPDAAQHENVALQIYRVPASATFGERAVNPFTHAYFPREKFDRVELRGSRIFGQHGAVFIALIAAGPLAFRSGSDDDLIQSGRDTAWACELSTTARDADFAAFVTRIESNNFSYREGRLAYRTDGRRLELNYGGDFRVNDLAQNTDYARHDSPYARTARQASTMTFDYAGKRLFLDFAHALRREQ